MEFEEASSGLWIPKGTTLEQHPAKTRNYASLCDMLNENPIKGVCALPSLVGLPVFDKDMNLSDRKVQTALAINDAIYKKILASDFMLRSALTFEDTVEHRAAGIGNSRRVRYKRDAYYAFIDAVVDISGNRDVVAYAEKHGIKEFGLGLQACSTVKRRLGISPKYSGSGKIIAEDLIEIVVNEGFSFDHYGNKPAMLRVLYEHNGFEWKPVFVRKDSIRYNPKRFHEISRKVLHALFNIAERTSFPKGVNIEYVMPKKYSEIFLVQYAPIPFMNEPELTSINFDYKNDPREEESLIVGCCEAYFLAEDIFDMKESLSISAAITALRKFNYEHPEGYLLLDRYSSTGRYWNGNPKVTYADISNATVLVDPYSGHHTLTACLSDHICQLMREEGCFVIAPNSWLGEDGAESKHTQNIDVSDGLSVQVDERTQRCAMSQGNVFI
ncbi:hypothetical protein COV16_06995 [Candidatus Woesearchaeota archaeon CG10_big_fil_rev_8_21_14_0_10_34_8]|nr:MAG: hypothetical protein COV16_06995 [Candidatus Woesearchaeota archaeon CG10_big_fil_rev_8_21_14_0_10_34_8]